MAVTSIVTHCERIPSITFCSSNSSKECSLQPNRLSKIILATDDNNMNILSKRRKSKKNKDFRSPYLTDDRILLHSEVTEERLVLKKAKAIISSFNLAANIYKANSDDFKSTKRNKKVKKSVLTLPNKQAPAPQTCTVSDLNDSEYDKPNYEHIMPRMKKKIPLQNSKKSRVRPKRELEFYDRDARYCSQMNINLDCSSTDMFKNFNGDGYKFSKRTPVVKNSTAGDNFNNPHDVWAVLRNINRFQFRPSPPMSEDNDKSPKKKKTLNKKRNKRKDTRVVETCHTEEYAYISSIEVDSKSTTNHSQSSSFDRITVIDNQDKVNEIHQEFENRINQMRSTRKCLKNKKSRNQNKFTKQFTVQQNKESPKSIAKTWKVKENIPNNDQRMLCDIKDEYIQNINDETYVAESNSTGVNGKITNVWNPNTMAPHTDNKTKKNSKSDILSFEGMIDQYDEKNDSFVSSCNYIIENEKAIKQHVEDSDQPIKGITKVVLSKGQNMALSRRLDLQKKNARLMTTMPKVVPPPKLTQTEIKRQLGNLKFPLVILGKDQVSSTVKVKNQDHPQFSGLDKQIWPFMLEWNDIENKKQEHSKICPHLTNFKAGLQKNIENDLPVELPKDRKIVNTTIPNKQLLVKNRNVNVDTIQIKKKWEQKRPFVLADANVKQEVKKPKPMRQFKDKVIKFLYKKPPLNCFAENELGDDYKQIVAASKDSTHKINACTEKYIERGIAKKNSNVQTLIYSRSPIARYPWSKAKWASDFIDTVIRKIKNGVYYNHEIKEQKSNNGPKEASIQTIRTCTSNSTYCDTNDLKTTPLVLNDLSSWNTIIPGFDNSFPVVEIKTLNMNQIEVKHCVTNIMVQFDVKVPMDPKHVLNVKKSSSITALKLTDSNTQIFKCKTSILNAMLPAELCSLLPKMLHRITKTDIKLPSPVVTNETGFSLSKPSKITCYQSTLYGNSLTLNPTHICMKPEILKLSEGMFSNETRRYSNYSLPKISILRICCNMLAIDLLPKLRSGIKFNCDKIYPIPLNTPTIKQIPASHTRTKEQTLCTNTSLVPYTGINQRNKIISTFQPYDFINIFKKFYTNHNITDNVIILRNSPIQINCATNSISMNMSISSCFNKQQPIGFKTNVYINMTNFKMDSLYNWFQKAFLNQSNEHNRELDKNEVKCVKRIDDKCEMKEIVKMEYHNKRVNASHKKKCRKGFVKLPRKFKSTSNMCSEKCTSLCKITNLEDFLDIIGTGRQLSSVFDDRIGKKILSSLVEMKSWISAINPRQALLIMLLMNKKDTPNLVRFRTILLQGIAVNRITRGTELDMEIEVIETENLNKIPKYQGILYPEESIDHDHLLEELYWIAKTTASDYQRPFDESSEKLLKSLLEKRKKLNPSYLRVMARYVGLGLLKSPFKTNKQ